MLSNATIRELKDVCDRDWPRVGRDVVDARVDPADSAIEALVQDFDANGKVREDWCQILSRSGGTYKQKGKGVSNCVECRQTS